VHTSNSHLSSKTKVLSQLLLRQRSLHITQLLMLHHRLRHLSLRLARVVVSRAERRTLGAVLPSSRRSQRRGRAPRSTFKPNNSRRRYLSLRSRQREEILATAVVPNPSPVRDGVHRLRWGR
jgi:hypothetical protein